MTYKRIMAFLIDILLVTVVSTTLCGIPKVNPYLDKYEEATSEYEETYEAYVNSITEGGSTSYFDEMNHLMSISKKVEKYKAYEVVYFVIFYLLYNVIFQYFNNGSTLGKRLFKLKVVNKDDKKVSLNNLFIRSMFNGSSLAYGVILIALIRTLTVLINNDITFYVVYSLITMIGLIYELIMLILLIKNKGNKSTHDYISGTKVIFYK